MAHREKYTRAAVGHLTAHFERKKDANGHYFKFNNQEIDVTRSHQNYNLATHDQPLEQNEFISKRTKELKCLNRKDVNVLMTWVITLPKEMNNKNDVEKRKFFEKSYEFRELLRLIEVVASCFNHYCVGCDVTQLNVLHNVHRRISLG